MSKRTRTVVFASLMILICLATLVGGTYALWSKVETVTTHISAGKMDVGFKRIGLVKKVVNSSTGYLDEKTYSATEAEADLTQDDVNVFDIADGEKLVPGSSYEAELEIKNNGDVAFEFDVVIKLSSVSNKLAEQLIVTVDGVEKGALSTFANDGQAVISTMAVEKNAQKTFKVKIEFKDDNSVNNDAMSLNADFDLIVTATQKTTNA